MLRLSLTMMLILGCSAPLFAQDIFPCRDQQGRLFVTDTPSSLPVGCALLGPPPGGGRLSVVHYEAPSPASRGAMTALSRQEDQRRAREELWRHRADALLVDYQSEVSDIYQAGRSKNRRDARQDLELIREKKRALLAEVRRDGRQAVREELEERLAMIDN